MVKGAEEHGERKRIKERKTQMEIRYRAAEREE